MNSVAFLTLLVLGTTPLMYKSAHNAFVQQTVDICVIDRVSTQQHFLDFQDTGKLNCTTSDYMIHKAMFKMSISSVTSS